MIWRKISNLAFGSILLVACVTAIMAQPATDRPRNEIDVRGLFSIPSGEASFSTTGVAGSVIDFDRDLGFDNEFGFELRYSHRSENNKHKFVVDYAQTDWARTRSASRSFTFLGETYQANLDTSSELKLRTFRGMYAYRWGNDTIRFGPMVNLGVISTKVNITGTTNSGTRTREGSITKFAGTVGYDVDYDPLPNLNIFHNLGGIVFKKDHLFHTEGGMKYFLARNIGVTGGYKYEWYKLADGDNFLTVQKHGPFFGGVLRF